MRAAVVQSIRENTHARRRRRGSTSTAASYQESSHQQAVSAPVLSTAVEGQQCVVQ